MWRSLAATLMALLCVRAAADVTDTNIRILQPYDAVTYNSHALNEFKTLFLREASSSLAVDPSRLIISYLSEDSGVGVRPILDTLGGEKSSAVEAYKGGTLLVHLRITSGTPSSESIYNDLWSKVTDETSNWYQGEITGRTDSGQVPQNHQQHSMNDGKTGSMSVGVIIPLGMAPLAVMLVMYIGMTGAAKRKPVVGDKGVKDEETRKKQKAKYKEEKAKQKEEKRLANERHRAAGGD